MTESGTVGGGWGWAAETDLLQELLAHQWPQECYKIKQKQTSKAQLFILSKYIFIGVPECCKRVGWKSNKQQNVEVPFIDLGS